MSNSVFQLPSISAEDALTAEAVLVDLRKPQAVAASGALISGALRRDPFAFGHQDPLTEEPRPILVFCVHGHEVSQFACALLMLHGRDVRYVTGGFEALTEAGAATTPLGGTEQ